MNPDCPQLIDLDGLIEDIIASAKDCDMGKQRGLLDKMNSLIEEDQNYVKAGIILHVGKTLRGHGNKKNE